MEGTEYLPPGHQEKRQKRVILGGTGIAGSKLHPVYNFMTLALSPGNKRNELSVPAAVFTCPLHSGCLIQSRITSVSTWRHVYYPQACLL